MDTSHWVIIILLAYQPIDHGPSLITCFWLTILHCFSLASPYYFLFADQLIDCWLSLLGFKPLSFLLANWSIMGLLSSVTNNCPLLFLGLLLFLFFTCQPTNQLLAVGDEQLSATSPLHVCPFLLASQPSNQFLAFSPPLSCLQQRTVCHFSLASLYSFLTCWQTNQYFWLADWPNNHQQNISSQASFLFVTYQPNKHCHLFLHNLLLFWVANQSN